MVRLWKITDIVINGMDEILVLSGGVGVILCRK